jgi:PST family polysaccharide transporter
MTSSPDLPAGTPSPEPAAPADGGGQSYGQILKSSVLIGGSSAINVALGVVRSKAMAVLLGPAGFGLMGLYASIANLAQSIAGMGVNSSGVRQIAVAVGSGDAGRIARTAAVLRRTSVALGVLGAVLLLGLSGAISRLTFSTGEHALPVALLSLAVLFRVVSDGQGALVQGRRQISDMARIAVYGGLLATGATIALVYFFGETGVVPSLIATAAATLIFTWWFSRKRRVPAQPMRPSEVFLEARALLELGFAFMASGMLTMGTAYAIRLFILRRVDVAAAGLYQSAWTLAGLYVGFVLQAMGADFYPRLTAIVRDREHCNRLVNEQAQISLLLAGPGVIATLTFAPLVLVILYSRAFADAAAILRWLCMGAALQVVSWPIGFIVVAEGRRGLFFWTELAFGVVHLGVAWMLVATWGAQGAGVAFFLSYVFHAFLIYAVVRGLTGFRWSATTRRLGAIYLAVIGLVFCGFAALTFWAATALGVAALLASTVHSGRTLLRLVPRDRLPKAFLRLLVRARIVPSRQD